MGSQDQGMKVASIEEIHSWSGQATAHFTLFKLYMWKKRNVTITIKMWTANHDSGGNPFRRKHCSDLSMCAGWTQARNHTDSSGGSGQKRYGPNMLIMISRIRESTSKKPWMSASMEKYCPKSSATHSNILTGSGCSHLHPDASYGLYIHKPFCT